MNKEKLLEERITYLERSNNRRESTILEQRQKINDLEDTVSRLNDLKQNLIKENKKLKDVLKEIKNIDVFKEFSFPLMKSWISQVLSSLDYQFQSTFIKKIKKLENSDDNEY